MIKKEQNRTQKNTESRLLIGNLCIMIGTMLVDSPTDLTLELKEAKKKSSSDVYMGCILIQCTLTSKSSIDYATQVS